MCIDMVMRACGSSFPITSGISVKCKPSHNLWGVGRDVKDLRKVKNCELRFTRKIKEYSRKIRCHCLGTIKGLLEDNTLEFKVRLLSVFVFFSSYLYLHG